MINVSVGVDQAGQDQLAGNVDHLGGAGRQDGLFDRRNAPVADRDVANAVDARRRANDTPAAQQKIIFRLFGHFISSSSIGMGFAKQREHQNAKLLSPF